MLALTDQSNTASGLTDGQVATMGANLGASIVHLAELPREETILGIPVEWSFVVSAEEGGCIDFRLAKPGDPEFLYANSEIALWKLMKGGFELADAVLEAIRMTVRLEAEKMLTNARG